ncbi:MAG TPA: tRNA preQ1(34) S-adenosylmethionine ribosyltransferase-isomerase QueA [Thermoanaerobaculia bacterium]|jgi:S-adenosylmethionine:tRNA ribosyltransferase-isomerase|nr:tRNA preQ1(34) S-adenosylmethionine ribosyltransferase-isomerase QueA [Thermoanaerobaculia bacterium]
MLTRDFDYDLPAESIAQQPAPRGESRLLVLDREGPDRHHRVRDLPRLLHPGDLLVLNDTRVIPARLYGRRASGDGKIEILLTEKISERDWDALVKPGRRARPGTVISFEGLTAEIIEKDPSGRHRLRFSEPIEPHLERLGHVPLPPYIHRSKDQKDSKDTKDKELYQTVYARQPGAIAAPTAGLHFSEELLAEIRGVGVETAMVTLHVGLGTFKPVTAERVADHRMERERWEVPAATAEAIRRTRERGGRLVAVGTTVVRTLESAARDGVVEAGSGTTELFITPGFPFQVVDALMTNFHLPQSTLLMLVSAFAGRERVLAAYAEAVREGYRFYSYGDAMLVLRAIRLASTAAP